MIVLIVSLISIIFLLYDIPYTKLDDLHGRYPSVWIGLTLQWFCNISLEIYHVVETYHHHFYGNMRIAMLIVQPALDILCMSFVFAYVYHKQSAIYCAVLVTFGWSLLRQLISLFFFTFVYPIEIISTVGIVAFGITISDSNANFKFNIVAKCLLPLILLMFSLHLCIFPSVSSHIW